MLDLTLKERLQLAAWIRHEGFNIFMDKILGDTCQEATQKLLLCDPTDRDRVSALQMRARDFNEFATLIRKTLNWEVLEGLAQQEIQQEAPNEHAGSNPAGNPYTSFTGLPVPAAQDVPVSSN